MSSKASSTFNKLLRLSSQSRSPSPLPARDESPFAYSIPTPLSSMTMGTPMAIPIPRCKPERSEVQAESGDENAPWLVSRLGPRTHFPMKSRPTSSRSNLNDPIDMPPVFDEVFPIDMPDAPSVTRTSKSSRHRTQKSLSSKLARPSSPHSNASKTSKSRARPLIISNLTCPPPSTAYVSPPLKAHSLPPLPSVAPVLTTPQASFKTTSFRPEAASNLLLKKKAHRHTISSGSTGNSRSVAVGVENPPRLTRSANKIDLHLPFPRPRPSQSHHSNHWDSNVPPPSPLRSSHSASPGSDIENNIREHSWTENGYFTSNFPDTTLTAPSFKHDDLDSWFQNFLFKSVELLYTSASMKDPVRKFAHSLLDLVKSQQQNRPYVLTKLAAGKRRKMIITYADDSTDVIEMDDEDREDLCEEKICRLMRESFERKTGMVVVV